MKEIVMSSFAKFVDAVKAKNGNPCSLRSVFPGRGKEPTLTRAQVKSAIGSQYEIDGLHKIVFDSKTGVYYFV